MSGFIPWCPGATGSVWPYNGRSPWQVGADDERARILVFLRGTLVNRTDIPGDMLEKVAKLLATAIEQGSHE